MIDEIKTFLWAMSPIVELRGSIPIALKIYGMPVWSAFLISVIGDLVPATLILLLLDPVTNWLSRHFEIFRRFFDWLFARTRRRHQRKFDKWKKFALVILVAIPLPFTGSWTASLCAYLFGIRFRQAIPLIAAGIVIAGILVTLISLGVFQFI